MINKTYNYLSISIFTLLGIGIASAQTNGEIDLGKSDPMAPWVHIEHFAESSSRSIQPKYPDTGFDKYASEFEIANVVNAANGEQLTDVALKIAEGERILVRKRKHFNANDLFELAIRTSMETKDTASLERLTLALETHKKTDLLAKAQLALNAAVESRTAGGDFKVSLNTTVEAFALAKFFQGQIKRAVALGDTDMIDMIGQTIELNSELLGKELVSHLDSTVKDRKQSLAANPKSSTKGMSALRELAKSSSREDEPDWTPTPPVVITGTQ